MTIGKETTKGGFEVEADQIIQGSMPFGVRGIDRYTVPQSVGSGGAGPAEIAGQNDPKMKFIEIVNDPASAGNIYLVDPDAPAAVVPADPKGGVPIEPGKSKSYPMRGYDPDNSKDVGATRPFFWYCESALVFGIVTRG